MILRRIYAAILPLAGLHIDKRIVYFGTPSTDWGEIVGWALFRTVD